MLDAFDFEPVAFANIPQTTYDFTAHGDGSEFTLRRNREAFDWVDIVRAAQPIDPARVNLESTFMGVPMKFPILIAPSATQGALHPDGEIGMHQAATEASNTLMVLSQNNSIPLEKVAPAAAGPMAFQFYPTQDMVATKRSVDAAQAAGCKFFVVTVDQQASYYERTRQSVNLGARGGGARGGAGRGGRGGVGGRGAAGGGAAPTGAARYRLGGGRLWYTCDYMEQVKKMSTIPVLLKGIVTAEDAKLCVERGMDGVIVSNHGGRSMDYGPSTMEVLPEIVSAVGGRIPVLIDSGFRRGSDVLKAMALGANGVMLGRAPRWGLAAFGTEGVQRLLEIIQTELVQAAAQAGCSTLASVNAKVVRTNFP
jgi:isopentenyl diphosphate isomerase/L-lactate dehydrogenase-like FMN-dependent dehydrogenase